MASQSSGAQPRRNWRTTRRRNRVAEVVAGPAGVGRAQQALVVPLHGALHGLEQFGATLVVASHLLVLVQRDAGPVGQETDGVDEVEVVHGPDEGDGVADSWQPKQ